MEKSLPIRYMDTVPVFVNIDKHLVAAPQQVAQSGVPTPCRVDPDGIQHRRLADAVLPSEQGYVAQSWDGQRVNSAEPLYVEVREVEICGIIHELLPTHTRWCACAVCWVGQITPAKSAQGHYTPTTGFSPADN